MRESIGGAWLYGIVIIFIFLFSGFLAYSISYTKAFNLKNKIVNLIEEYEGYSENDVTGNNPHDSVEKMAFNYILEAGYNYPDSQGIDCNGFLGTSGAKNESKEGGYCIVKYCNGVDNISNTHYKVTTFISLKLPVVHVRFKVPISGETRTIYSDSGGYPCTEGID